MTPPHWFAIAVGCTPEPAPLIDVDEVVDLAALGYLDFADAPEAENDEGGVVLRATGADDKFYTLVTSRNLRRTDLIDADGNRLRRWYDPMTGYWARARLMPNGDLVVAGQDAVAPYLLRLTWNGRERWRSDVAAHHDIHPMTEGRVATMLYRDRRIQEVERFFDLRDDFIAIIGPRGRVMEEISVWAALSAAPEHFTFQDAGLWVGDGRVKDLLHTNTIQFLDDAELAARDPLFQVGRVLVTLRNQDAVALIDWETRKVVWSWGQGTLLGPHDGTIMPNGNLLVLDNGVGRGWSRVLEVEPHTGEIVWRYQGDPPSSFYTASRGSAQRLPNGNTLITESDRARLFEVDPNGQIVWEFLNPAQEGQRATISRAERMDIATVEVVWRALECSSGTEEDDDTLDGSLAQLPDEYEEDSP